jgi:hypothetical protein
VFVVVVPLVYYVTHASLRYRHPIDPILLMLTAIALAGVKPPEATGMRVDSGRISPISD